MSVKIADIVDEIALSMWCSVLGFHIDFAMSKNLPQSAYTLNVTLQRLALRDSFLAIHGAGGGLQGNRQFSLMWTVLMTITTTHAL